MKKLYKQLFCVVLEEVGAVGGRFTVRNFGRWREAMNGTVALCVESNINKSIINIDKFIIVQ